MVDDKSKYTDWANRSDIKAELQMDLILILAEHGYPPVPQDEVFKEILIESCLCQKTVVITNQLEVPFTTDCLCNLFNCNVLFELLTSLRICIDFKVQTFVSHDLTLHIVNGWIELQIDGLHVSMRNGSVLQDYPWHSTPPFFFTVRMSALL